MSKILGLWGGGCARASRVYVLTRCMASRTQFLSHVLSACALPRSHKYRYLDKDFQPRRRYCSKLRRSG